MIIALFTNRVFLAILFSCATYSALANEKTYHVKKKQIERELNIQKKSISTTEKKLSRKQNELLGLERQLSAMIRKIELHRVSKTLATEALERLNLEIATNDASLNYQRESIKKIVLLRWSVVRRMQNPSAALFLPQETSPHTSLVTGTLEYLTQQQVEITKTLTKLKKQKENLYRRQAEKLQTIEASGRRYQKEAKLAKNAITNQERNTGSLQRTLQTQKRTLSRKKKDYRRLLKTIERIAREARKQQLAETGFASMKGRLSWPVKGEILKQGDSLIGEGIELSVKNGTYIRAVYEGRVIFANAFPGFKMLVVVDHGGGYYSLYGYNQSIFADEGDAVAAGDIIGIVGGSYSLQENKNRHLKNVAYFEIRKESKSENPLAWLTKN